MASGSKEPIAPIFWHIAQTGLIEIWVVRRSRWSTIYQRTFGEAWVWTGLLPNDALTIKYRAWKAFMMRGITLQNVKTH